MPATLPRIVCWIVGLTCLGVREVRSSPVFQWRQESSGLGGKGGRGCTDLGETSVFPRRGCACLGKSAVFPSLAAGMWGGWKGVRLGGKGGNSLGKIGIFHRRGREGGRGLRWEVLAWERLASSPGGVAPAWGRALSSPAWLLVCEGGTCLGRPVVFPGGCLGGYLTVT